MNTNTSRISIDVKDRYDVYIASGLLSRCGELISSVVSPCRAAVISDTNVAPLYADTVTDSLEKAGFSVCSYAFTSGESSKSMRTLADVLEFFAANQLTRGDCAVALGGGVTGDITGFAAGCYMRGIPFIQLPTTLLAAVDSSVGGKTGVNLETGKNLAGLFLQPKAVICDTDCLKTLSQHYFTDGIAEALKTSILGDESLFGVFENENYITHLNEVIAKCVMYKGKIVTQDEFEHGSRKLLNLGHTAGHAIELLSNYKISHGMAVAAGIGIMARASAHAGLCTKECASRIENTLLRHGLPVNSLFSPQEIAGAAMADKKRNGKSITIVAIRDIGKCELVETDADRLTDLFRSGTE